MGYIEQSLGEGERIVAVARFHWWYTVGAWLALLVPVVLALAALRYADADAQQGARIGAIVLFLFGFALFLKMMIRRWTTEIGVTSHRFVEKSGLFALHTNEIALPNIEGVRVRQSLGGRIWGYGRLRIEGTGIDAVELPTIADPIGFRRALETAKGIKA